jgi:hypothetical protein
MDEKMTLDQMSELMEIAVDPSVLVAAGGWCAPHEISYDFYNIVCSDGTLDLRRSASTAAASSGPRRRRSVTSRRSPVSPGPGLTRRMSRPSPVPRSPAPRPCVRVQCPAYNDATLACDGMCVTVGNLTNDAFPELIQNHLRLVEAIHYHYMNTRLIQQMVLPANSTAVTTAGSDVSSSWGLLNSAAFQRRDLIEKYQMCDDAIMEAVFPRFAKDKIRADMSMRTGVDSWQAVSDSMIADWFDARNIRTQFVSDWQVRASGQPGASTRPTNWAVNTQYMMYPAGTFVRGQGMTLDLGVVRDSVLNATNDYTAAWMEECWLLAKIGHESRLVTVDDCVNGISGAASASACNV